MNKPFLTILLSIVSLLVISCAPAHENKSDNSTPASGQAEKSVQTDEAEALQAPEAVSYISSSAAVEKGSDTSRRFIRTADLRFRVPDVIKASYKIEDITRLNEGFVASANLTSTVDYEENKPLTADSNLIITHFTVNNTFTLRVPVNKLDTTLKQIAPLIDFLDYRIINAKDVALDILSNRLAQKRTHKHDERLSKVVEGNSVKTTDITNAAESLLRSEEAADQALLSELTLKDQVRFSTISIQLYQRQSVKYSKVANEKSIRAYEPGFFSRLWDAFMTGFDYLKEFIIFLFKIWWLIIILLAVVFVYPKIRKKKFPVIK